LTGFPNEGDGTITPEILIITKTKTVVLARVWQAGGRCILTAVAIVALQTLARISAGCWGAAASVEAGIRFTSGDRIFTSNAPIVLSTFAKEPPLSDAAGSIILARVGITSLGGDLTFIPGVPDLAVAREISIILG